MKQGLQVKKDQSDTRQGGEEKKLTKDFPFPDPMQLAQLAAILDPASEPRHALTKAMKLYFEAVLVSRELPSDFQTLFLTFGNPDRLIESAVRCIRNANEALRADSLTLEPNKSFDDARSFIDAHARHVRVINKREHLFKSARSVIKNLRDFRNSIPISPGTKAFYLPTDQWLEQLKCSENGSVTYNIPRSWLIDLVEYKKNQTSEVRKTGWETRRKSTKRRAKKLSKKIVSQDDR